MVLFPVSVVRSGAGSSEVSHDTAASERAATAGGDSVGQETPHSAQRLGEKGKTDEGIQCKTEVICSN